MTTYGQQFQDPRGTAEDANRVRKSRDDTAIKIQIDLEEEGDEAAVDNVLSEG